MKQRFRQDMYPGLTPRLSVVDACAYFRARRVENHGSFPADAAAISSRKRALYEQLFAIADGVWSGSKGQKVAIYTHTQPAELRDMQLVVTVNPQQAIFMDRAGNLGSYTNGTSVLFSEHQEAHQLAGLEDQLAQVFGDDCAASHTAEGEETVYHL